MIKKEGVTLLILAVFVSFVASFASAEVFFSQPPNSVYNLGEKIDVLIGSDGNEGWLNVDLVCNNSKKIVFFDYLNEGETAVQISVPLKKSFLGELKGDCFLSMAFNSLTKESLHFNIVNSLNVNIIWNNNIFRPNESIFFTGSASKPSKNDVNGFAEISFPYNDLEIIVPIIDGKFNGNFSLQDNIPSSDYEIKIFAYEKDNLGEITNFYIGNSSINVIQVPRFLVVNVPNNAFPGNNLEFTSYLYDQASSAIDSRPVAFTFINSEGEQVFNSLSETSKTNYYLFRKNDPFGYWNLSAQSEGLNSAVYQVYVNKNTEAEFLLINNTLVIRNIGNVPYDKLIEISIGGNYTRVLATNLSLGGVVEYGLEAPDGNYTIKVSDGKASFDAVASLTGSVIGLKSYRSGRLNFFNKYIFSWVVVIAILGLFIFISAMRIINKRSVFSMKNIKNEGVIRVSPITTSTSEDKSNKPDFISVSENTAHSSLVIKGHKQKASILSLKIKNREEIPKNKSNATDLINEIPELIFSAHGKIYHTKDHIMGIFAPVVTRTFDNNINVVGLANTIYRKLKDHNNKYIPKIKFGIGVDDADIIAEKKDGKLLFTPVGNSFQNVKKISDVANDALLLSESVNKSLGSKIKTIANSERSDLKTYFVSGDLNKVGNSEFINKFLNRNKYN